MFDTLYVVTDANGVPINAAAHRPVLAGATFPVTLTPDDAAVALAGHTEEPTFAWNPGRRLFMMAHQGPAVVVLGESDWRDVNVFLDGTHTVDHGMILVGGRAQVSASGDARVAAVGDARVIACDDVQVEARGSAHVTATDRVTVSAAEHACVEARDECRVFGSGEAHLALAGHAWGTAADGTVANVSDEATIVADDRSSVDVSGMGLATVKGDAKVWAVGHARVIATERARVTVQGDAQVSATGACVVFATERARVAALQDAETCAPRIEAWDDVHVRAAGARTTVLLYHRALADVDQRTRVEAYDDTQVTVFPVPQEELDPSADALAPHRVTTCDCARVRFTGQPAAAVLPRVTAAAGLDASAGRVRSSASGGDVAPTAATVSTRQSAVEFHASA